MSKINKLLVERHRPVSVDDYVFPDEKTKEKVMKWLKAGEVPHILLAGLQGVGKTSLANVIINELGVYESDVKRINASTLKTADIENELIPWMKKAAFGKMKIVLLDEADRIDPNHGQKILRNVIEAFSDHVRFIATCNYKNKITPPLHSRFQMVEINSMDEEGVIEYIVRVIEKENLTFCEDNDVFSHIDAYSPDIRKILNSIDEHTSSDGVISPLISKAGSEDIDQWEAIWSDKDFSEEHVAAAMELVPLIDESNFEEFYEVMYKNSYQFPDENNAIVLLSQYLERAMRCANQPLHLKAFLIQTFFIEE